MKEVTAMHSEFAYSRFMQMILAGLSFITAYIFVYCITNLILQMYGETSSTKRKGIFAFLAGVVLDSAWVYAVYFLGGRQSFSIPVYSLVVTTNPITALLYYFIGTKVLKISPARSIKLMGYVYLYFVTVKSLSRLVGSIFFIQPSGRYNYMLDALYRITFLFIFLGIFFSTQYVLAHHKNVRKLKVNLFINHKKEMALYLIKATAIYLFAVGTHIVVTEQIAANMITLFVLMLTLALTIIWDLYGAMKIEAENNTVHINTLSKRIVSVRQGEFFDLTTIINENPLLISTLIKKREYAEKLNVQMRIILNSCLQNFHIDNADICKIIDCLLDNAIETAAVSENKIVSFTVESKADRGKLCIISNSTTVPVDTGKIIFRGALAEKQHYGKGHDAVSNLVAKYGNCIFHMVYYNYQMSAYLEMKPTNLYRLFSSTT